MKEKENKIAERHIDLDELFTKVEPANFDVVLNGKYKYFVKTNNKYGKRNSTAAPRFVLTDEVSYFTREAEAYEAARILGGKVVREDA